MSVSCTKHRALQCAVYSPLSLALPEYRSPLEFTSLILHLSLCVSKLLHFLLLSRQGQAKFNIHPHKSRIILNQGWIHFGNTNPHLAWLNFLVGNTEGCNFFEMNLRFITTLSSSDKGSRTWCKMIACWSITDVYLQSSDCRIKDNERWPP